MKHHRAMHTTAMCTAMLAMAGCGYRGAASLPLPGGVSGSDTYRVTAVLDDATNLVPKETCRSNDVTVGSVDSVTIGHDLKAHVVCVIKNSVRLPANAVATLESTSLLGERFVALGPPAGEQPKGQMPPSTVIPDSGTRVDPDTEQLLGALSAVLNGGDLPKIAVITQQLNQAMSGHEGDIRALLAQLTDLTGTLNAHRTDITHALDALDHLSGTLAAQRDALGSAIDTIPAGLKVLNDQRPQLIALLQHLQQLSRTAVPLIAASHDNTVEDLQLLQPVLQNLAVNSGQLATALRLLMTYPFANDSGGAVKGDYNGEYVTMSMSLDAINTLLQQQLATPAVPAAPGTAPAGALPLPAGAVPGLPPLPGVITPTTPVASAPPQVTLGGLLSGGTQ